MTSEQPPQNYPSYTRFYVGAFAIGMAVGITWTLFVTGVYAQRFITKTHAIELLYGIALVALAQQAWMLRRWGRVLKQRNAELADQWAEIEKKIGRDYERRH
jgi:hypothetical protein